MARTKPPTTKTAQPVDKLSTSYGHTEALENLLDQLTANRQQREQLYDKLKHLIDTTLRDIPGGQLQGWASTLYWTSAIGAKFIRNTYRQLLGVNRFVPLPFTFNLPCLQVGCTRSVAVKCFDWRDFKHTNELRDETYESYFVDGKAKRVSPRRVMKECLCDTHLDELTSDDKYHDSDEYDDDKDECPTKKPIKRK